MAVVSGQGSPSLLLSVEEQSHLLAIDLKTGEPRWRIPCGQGPIRTRRIGKLMADIVETLLFQQLTFYR